MKTETKLHVVYVKYDLLVDFIRPDPAEIRRLVGQTPLVVSARVGEASTGVFVLVVCAFNRPIAIFSPKLYIAKAQHPRSRPRGGVACAREGGKEVVSKQRP